MSQLPKCIFPKAFDVNNHGLQKLPDYLPRIDFTKAEEFGSANFQPIQITEFTNLELLEMVELIAQSFVVMEPMNRHIYPPRQTPSQIKNIEHTGPLGKTYFGPWTKENIFHWFIRIQIISSWDQNTDSYKLNDDVINLSLAIKDEKGSIIGGAFNMTIQPESANANQDETHPFVDAISPFIAPPLELVMEQEHDAIEAVCHKYSGFSTAYKEGKVGCHFLVARSVLLPSEDTFELVLSSAKHFQKMGYSYLIISATNNWTGAACELLNGIRIHFSPYRTVRRVKESKDANPHEAYSSDGFISDKDSGSMFYLIKLSA